MEGRKNGQSDAPDLDELTSGIPSQSSICQPGSQRDPDRKDQEKSANIWWQFYKHRGVFFVILAAFFSALHSVLVSYVNDEVHTMQISFTRFLLQFLLPVPILTYSGISPKAKSNSELVMLIMRGLIGMVALTSLFYSFQFTSVGNASAIVFGSPVFVGIFGRIFLKETFGIVDAILVVIVIGGVFLISQPPFLFGSVEEHSNSTNFIGALLAFFTCICMSLTTVLMGKMGKLQINSFKIVLYYATVASVVTALLTTILQVWSIPSCGRVRFTLVGMGVLNCFAQCLVAYSLSIERSIFVAILRSNEVIFAYLLEFIIFSITPSIIPVIGVCLVLSGSILASLKKMWLSRKKGIAKRKQSELSNHIEMELN